MSGLENALSGLMGAGEETAVTVAKELLNQKSAIMHTDIHNPSCMIALDIVKKFASSMAAGRGLPKTEAVFGDLHQGNVVYPVSEKRKGRGEIVKVLEAQMAILGMQQTKEKSGWLGNGKK